MLIAINAILFQCIWFINITQSLWISFYATLTVLVVHLGLVYRQTTANVGRAALEGLWLILLFFVGFLVEQFFFFTGTLVLTGEDVPLFAGVPYWLLLIWMAFGTTFYFSFRFICRRLYLAPILGAFACLSYAGGAALSSSVDLSSQLWSAVLVIACAWSVVLTLLAAFYRTIWKIPHD